MAPEKADHWFEWQTGGGRLGLAQWIPVKTKGWLTFIGIGLAWLGGPYLLSNRTDQIGVLPGLFTLVIAVGLLSLAVWKTKRVKFD